MTTSYARKFYAFFTHGCILLRECKDANVNVASESVNVASFFKAFNDLKKICFLRAFIVVVVVTSVIISSNLVH
jgi:hypothetical protein